MSEILLKNEVCEKYRISPKTMDYLIASKQIPYHRIGKRGLRFCSEELKQWFKQSAMVEYKRNVK